MRKLLILKKPFSWHNLMKSSMLSA